MIVLISNLISKEMNINTASFIEKFEPINTNEKVLDIINEIKKLNMSSIAYDNFVNEVCIHIRKAKLQILFREEIIVLKSRFRIEGFKPAKEIKSKKIKSPVKANNNNKVIKSNSVDIQKIEQQELNTIINRIENIRDYTAEKIAEILHWDFTHFSKLMKQNSIEIKNDEELSDSDFDVVYDLIKTRFKALYLQEKENQFNEKYNVSFRSSNNKYQKIKGKTSNNEENVFDKMASVNNHKKIILIRSR